MAISSSNAFIPSQPGVGLKVVVGGGSFQTSTGSISLVPAATLSVTANATNFIYFNSLIGTIQQNTTGVPLLPTNLPIATVVTDATEILSLTDNRPDLPSLGGGGSSAPAYVPYNIQPDLFNRASLGSNWTVYLNGFTVTPGVVNGSTATGSALNVAAWTGTPSVATQTASVVIGTLGGGGGAVISISGTPTTSVSYYQCGENSSNIFTLQKVVGASNSSVGTVTTLGTTTISAPGALNGDRLTISRVGNTITCQRNGTGSGNLFVVNDPSPIPNGLPGIGIFSTAQTLSSWSFTNAKAPSTATKVIVADGDSITAANGQGSNNTDPYTNYLQIGSATNTFVSNLGVNSKCVGIGCAANTSGTIESMLSTGTSVVDTLCVPGADNIVILMGGTNDIVNSRTPAQIYTDITTYVTNRHAAAGCNWKVAIVPQVSRGNGNSTDVSIQALNSLIYLNTAGADAIVQLTPQITSNNASANTLLFNSDQIHPTELVHIDILSKAISSTLSLL